jgi:hypothetical protein
MRCHRVAIGTPPLPFALKIPPQRQQAWKRRENGQRNKKQKERKERIEERKTDQKRKEKPGKP